MTPKAAKGLKGLIRWDDHNIQEIKKISIEIKRM